MRRRDFLLTTGAAAATPIAFGVRAASAQEPTSARWAAAVKAQERFDEAVKAGLADHYIAPLHTDRNGPQYLWGGLDPIAMVESYYRQIDRDKGQDVFLSPWPRQDRQELGKPEFALEVPVYRGGPTKTTLFASAANRERFQKQTADGTFMVLGGMNCLWGLACTPATADWPTPQASHFAQPGLGMMYVDRFPDARARQITTVGAVLYFRGGDWKAVSYNGPQLLADAFQMLLEGKKPWRRLRPYLPVLTLGDTMVGRNTTTHNMAG